MTGIQQGRGTGVSAAIVSAERVDTVVQFARSGFFALSSLGTRSSVCSIDSTRTVSGIRASPIGEPAVRTWEMVKRLAIEGSAATAAAIMPPWEWPASSTG